MSEAPDVAVVGAGIAGAVAARRLLDAGLRVVVVDKARGVGGRMATRRIGDAVLDHGAQFFTTPGNLLGQMVAQWHRAGAAVGWFEGHLRPDGGLDGDGHVRWRGADGMTSVAKHLLAGTEVRTSTRLTSVGPTEVDGAPGWTLRAQGAAELVARRVLLTPPVPQTLELLARGGTSLRDDDQRFLGALTYHPCLAVLAVLDRPSGLPAPGIVRPAGEPLEVAVDNQRKGISAVPALTLHAGPATSAALWEAPDEDVAAALFAALGEVVPGAPGRRDVSVLQVHRWRYARPVEVVAQRCHRLVDHPGAVLAGDVFGGPLVGGAARSGWCAAGVLLQG